MSREKPTRDQASMVDWRLKPAVVPLPGKEPYICVLCRERVAPGVPVRYGPRKAYGVHDDCARKIPLDAPRPARKGKAGPPRGELSLARWEAFSEDVRQHRALLLYAMQHEPRRSQRGVGRAVSVAEGTIRQWCSKFSWAERMKGTAGRVDEQAAKLYRELYAADYGPTELPEVADRVIVPLGVQPRDAGVQPPSEVEENIREADRLVREEILRKRKADDEVRTKHVKLVDGALGYVVKEMQEGRIRASLRDIPTLLQARALLSGEVSSSNAAAGGAPIESMRVRVAREQGTDFLDAVAEDVEELAVIVATLRGRRADAASVPQERAAAGAPGLRVVGPDEAG